MQDNNLPQTTSEPPVSSPPADPLAPNLAAPAPETGPTTVTQAPDPVSTPEPKKGLSKVAKIIIGIVAAIIGLIVLGIVALLLIVNLATKAPLDVSNKFFNDLQANQPAAAYQLTSTEFKDSVTQAQLESLFTTESSLYSGTEKVTGKKVQATNGVSQAVVTYSVDGSTSPRYARIVLKKDGSDWKVINFRTSPTVLETVFE